MSESGNLIPLPPPRTDGVVPVERCLAKRRSERSFKQAVVSLADAGQLLWAAQGITDPEGLRTAPSAGATYPLETYLLCGQVEGLAPGVYKYLPRRHALTQVMAGDRKRELAVAAFDQSFIHECSLVILLTAVYARTARRYGDRAFRYVHMEAGHAAENVSLQAIALGLGSVHVGAFSDAQVKQLLALPHGEEPLYIVPAGGT